MNRKTWDSWGVSIVAGLLTGIPLAIGSIYVGAWVTGTPIKHPLSLAWLVAELHLNVPVWFVFPFIGLAAVLTTVWFRQMVQTRMQRAAG